MKGKFEALEDRVSAAITAADPAAFDILALDLFQFQREFNSPYDQYCRLLGVNDSPKSWREIPALPQAAFKHAPLRAFPADAEVAAFRTSGTTGEGFGTHHFRSLRLYEEAILRGWDLLGLPSLPQIILVPPPAAAPHSSLSYMMGVLRARAPGGEQHWCFGADPRPLLERATSPVMLLGTALAFLHLFESANPIALPTGSLAFETGGYKGSGRSLSKESLYEMFHTRLGLTASDIINEYGMTELSSQCHARGLASPHVAPPWMRAIVIDPSTNLEVPDGEPGLLRIYDLANLSSILAIQTRDIAIRRGANFELLGRDPAALPRGCSRAADKMLAP